MKCPDSIEELDEMVKMIPLCKVTLYEHAKSKIESGAAKSVSEASRQLAEETGKPPGTIRDAIRRESNRRTDEPRQLSKLSGTDKHRPPKLELTTKEKIAVVNHAKLIAQEKHESQIQFRTSFTGDNEWYTPIKYIEAAREVMGSIDVDPASSEFAQGRIRANEFYTIETDGLKKSWVGNIWLNPPYAQPIIYHFIEKFIKEYTSERNVKQAIILTHNYTDTAWFHRAESVVSLICFTKGRVKFEKSDGTIAAPTQGSAFFYYGPHKMKFQQVFGRFGFVR